MKSLVRKLTAFTVLLTFFMYFKVEMVHALTIEDVVDREKASATTPEKKKENREGTRTYEREPDKKKPLVKKEPEPVEDIDFHREFKDPRLACLLSTMMPGAGHIYLRRDIKGGGFCLLTGAGYSLAGYFTYQATAGSAVTGDFVSRFTIPGIFIFLGAAVHIIAIIEAHSDAEEINKKLIIYGKDAEGRIYRGKIIIEK